MFTITLLLVSFYFFSLDSEGAVHSPFSEMSPYIKLYSNGTIVWQGDTVLKVYCNIRLTAFPSDGYTCDLCFGSRNYGKNEIYLNWWNEKLFNSSLIENKEWIIYVSREGESTSEQCSSWEQSASNIVLKMSLKRNADAYHVTFFVPCLFLSIIMFLAFIVPTETGERLNLIVTVLLTIIVFQQLTLDIIPPYSFPILSQYYFFCLILAFSSTVIDIILLNVYTRSGRCLPDILHTFFIEWVGALVYMTRNYYNYGTGEYDIPYQHVQEALQQEQKITKMKYGKIENTIYSLSPEKEIIWNSFKISTDCLHKRNKMETIKLLIQEEKRLAFQESSEFNFEKIRDEVKEEVNKHQIYRLVRVLDRLFLFASFFAVVGYSSYYLALVLS